MMSEDISGSVEKLENILPAFREKVERFADAEYIPPKTMGKIVTEIYYLCLILLQDVLFAEGEKRYEDVKTDAAEVVLGSNLASD